MFQTPEFWVAVGFIIFVLAAAKPAMRAFAAMLDARAERIGRSIDEAARLREEAQHLLAEYQRRQRDAAREIDAIVAQARAEAERMTTEGAERLEALLKRREQLAVDRIAQAETEALQQVRNVAVDVAIAAARRLIAERMDEAARTRLVDRAIADLPARLH
jgi:F-type H+-transporting ATPase subunit b